MVVLTKGRAPLPHAVPSAMSGGWNRAQMQPGRQRQVIIQFPSAYRFSCYLLLISSLIPLWSENNFYVISYLNLLRYALCLQLQSVLVNVLWMLQKNVASAVGWGVKGEEQVCVCVRIRFYCLIVVFKYSISLPMFCLGVLSIVER